MNLPKAPVLILSLTSMNLLAQSPAPLPEVPFQDPSSAASAAALLSEYARSPDTHPNLPNVSFAGYRASEAPLPDTPVVANVRETGAKGDGTTDDSAAFQSAIDKAKAAGGGTILVPAGNYMLSQVVRLDADNLILKGECPGRSILTFSQPLQSAIGPFPAGGSTRWSWSGGMVWIAPADSFKPDGKLADTREHRWEKWKVGKELASIEPAERGAATLTVSSTEGIKAGDYVAISYASPADNSLMAVIAGHPKVAEWDFNRAVWLKAQPYVWPVQVKAVSGNTLTLAQPLRVPILPQFEAKVFEIGSIIQETGVRGLTIAFPPHPTLPHNKYEGYNGIYVNRAINCFIENVEIVNSDNGIIHASAKHTTTCEIKITGGFCHHATAMREFSADNLIESFFIDADVMHGINMEWLSSGNVWREGTMKKGTFDSHCGLPFDSVRTNITINNTGKPGGAKQAGPFAGARVVHWNIDVSGPGDFINQPEQFPMGALVGVRGAPLVPGTSFAMPAGEKGTLVLEDGQKPTPDDLFTEQLKLRLGNR